MSSSQQFRMIVFWCGLSASAGNLLNLFSHFGKKRPVRVICRAGNLPEITVLQISVLPFYVLIGICMSLLIDCHSVPRYFLWEIYDMNPVSLIIPFLKSLYFIAIYNLQIQRRHCIFITFFAYGASFVRQFCVLCF